MSDPPAHLRRSLAAALSRERRSLDDLLDRSTELVLFGSRAAGLAESTSDWDLLWIGPRPIRANTRTLDIIPLKTSQCISPPWLESELASHIAAHGIWLKGSGAWRAQTRITARTLAAKTHRIMQHVELLERWGNDLTQDVLLRNFVRLRRDLQRYSLLMNAIPIPTTAELETMWHVFACHNEYQQLLLLANELPRETFVRVRKQIESCASLLTWQNSERQRV